MTTEHHLDVEHTSSNVDASQDSQTAQDFITSQLSLEADAREALPYRFDACTKPLGPLRQAVYACLTCAPPPASEYQQSVPAGVCYSCSISCHGEHNLVELFTKRDFVCDCGTTRLSTAGTPCMLRTNALTHSKGNVTGEQAWAENQYNQNFYGKFCACGEEYDPEVEKGTMFQCLGLGTIQDGGCGEDWWHPGCLMGLPRPKHVKKEVMKGDFALNTTEEEQESMSKANSQHDNEEMPKGFPEEDDFDHLICYKCTNAFPWIKQYAGTAGFLSSMAANGSADQLNASADNMGNDLDSGLIGIKKRKAEVDTEAASTIKRTKTDKNDVDHLSISPAPAPSGESKPKHVWLPSSSAQPINLFAKEDFREHLCRCPTCFPRLAKHPQLLEGEDTYEPPVSESGGPIDDGFSNTGHSVHSGSLLGRGEAALSSMDRVRAIEGVMAYNHVRDKVKTFLQPFAASGQPVGAEDVKAFFAKLRGDDQAMREAATGATTNEVQDNGR